MKQQLQSSIKNAYSTVGFHEVLLNIFFKSEVLMHGFQVQMLKHGLMDKVCHTEKKKQVQKRKQTSSTSAETISSCSSSLPRTGCDWLIRLC